MKWGNEFRGRPRTPFFYGTKRQQPSVGWFPRPQLVSAESSDIFHPVTNPPALYQHQRQSGVNPCGVCHVRVSPLTLTVFLSLPSSFFPLFLRLVLSPSFSFLLFWESCQVPLFNSRAESSPRCRGNTPMAHRHTFFLLFLFFFLLLLVMLIFSFPLCPTVPETLEMFKVI